MKVVIAKKIFQNIIEQRNILKSTNRIEWNRTEPHAIKILCEYCNIEITKGGWSKYKTSKMLKIMKKLI